MEKYLITLLHKTHHGLFDNMVSLKKIIDKSIFFLGAGFSMKAECKTSIDMFINLRKRIFDENDMTFTHTQKEALKFLLACLQYHGEWRTMESLNGMTFKPNIEELALLIRRIRNRENFLPYPITGNWADKLVTLESQYFSESKNLQSFANDGLFDSLERKFKVLLKNDWLHNSGNFNYLEPLLNFIKNSPDEKYEFDIFSLNNDLVIEEYFSKNNEIPWRGFVNGKWQGIIKDNYNDPFGRINLYKLHGSIDWVRLEDMDIWEESKLDNKREENIQEKHNPYIIFGQGTKTFSVEPFFTLINHFHKQLNSNNKEYFFIIGYSFFDPYINNILFNAIKEFKKLIIINPFLGPEKFYINDEIPSNTNNFFRIKYPAGSNPSDLTDYLREIQKNSFYSELPEFNYITASAENIEFIPLKTEDFINHFFQNDGELLREFIEKFEKQKDESKPF